MNNCRSTPAASLSSSSALQQPLSGSHSSALASSPSSAAVANNSTNLAASLSSSSSSASTAAPAPFSSSTHPSSAASNNNNNNSTERPNNNINNSSGAHFGNIGGIIDNNCSKVSSSTPLPAKPSAAATAAAETTKLSEQANSASSSCHQHSLQHSSTHTRTSSPGSTFQHHHRHHHHNPISTTTTTAKTSSSSSNVAAAVSSPMTMRRLANAKIVSKREANIITRNPADSAVSSDEMTFSSGSTSSDETADNPAQQRQQNLPAGQQNYRRHHESKQQSSSKNLGHLGMATSSTRHLSVSGAMTAGGVAASVPSLLSADDLSVRNVAHSSDYFEENFPSLKHAISKLSTAASLGSDSGSLRDDDFDDDDDDAVDFDYADETDSQATNKGQKQRPVSFLLPSTSSDMTASSQLPQRHHSFAAPMAGSPSKANAPPISSLVDEMTNMHVHAMERRLMLTPDRHDTAVARAFPMSSTGGRHGGGGNGGGGLSMSQKKCMSVSNVSTMEQQIAFGFPAEPDTFNYSDEVQAMRLLSSTPRKSALNLDSICSPTSSATNNSNEETNNTSMLLRQQTLPASMHHDPPSPMTDTGLPPGDNPTRPPRRERTKSYTATQLTVPKILFS